MQRRITYFFKSFTIAASVLAFQPWTIAQAQYLPPVPAKTKSQVLRNIAPMTAGTLFSKGSADGKWTPPASDGADSTVDPGPAAHVDPGKQDFLFEFNNLEQVNRLAFQQKSKGGVVRVFAADAAYPADSPRWKNINDASVTGSESVVNMEFPITSMRYMRMTVEYPEGGELGSFLLSGDTFVEDSSEMVPPPEEWPNTTDRIDFDFARSAAGGKITHVGSGKVEESHNITDGDPTTFHEFEPNEKGVYFNIALAEDYPIYKASILTDQAIGSVELWTFMTLPDELLSEETNDGQARGLNVSEAFISQREPNGRIKVSEDEDLTELIIPLPETTARYMLVKVIPKYPDQPIRVRMFSAKGRVPRELFSLPSSDRTLNPFSSQTSEADDTPEDLDSSEIPRIPVASP